MDLWVVTAFVAPTTIRIGKTSANFVVAAFEVELRQFSSNRRRENDLLRQAGDEWRCHI